MKRLDLAEAVNKRRVVWTSGPMVFHKLYSGGYQLAKDYWAQSRLMAGYPAKSKDGLVEQTAEGRMILKAGFRCDGPSGPTVDTEDFMPGAFIHDGGYKLCREGKVKPWTKWRKNYDKTIVAICETKGMGWFRRKYVYFFLRMFAGYAAKPQADEETRNLQVP